MMLILTLLFQTPTWLTGFNFLIALFTLLVLIGGAIIVLMAKGRGEAATIQIDRAVAAEALVKTRDAEKEILRADNKALEEELESVTAEHRTLVGIDIAKLMDFWATKEMIEAQMADLQRENRILRLRKDGDINGG